MIKIVLVRHGESQWNLDNRFTGWTDVDITEKGKNEAWNAGVLLKDAGYSFDSVYTSVLKRAIRTAWTIMDAMDLMWLPVHNHWRLNERHYGALQGLNKAETAEKFGMEQVHIWRRSYDTPPPVLETADERHPRNDSRYATLDADVLPATESLKTTLERVLPYWHDVIAPVLKAGKKPIIVAHGNSIRALVKYLDAIPESEITELNIPTGIPLVYELDEVTLRPIRHYYLGDQEELKKKIDAVANQAKKK